MMCVFMRVCVHAIADMKRSENNFMELLLTFHFYMDGSEQTHMRQIYQVPLPTETSLWLQSLFLLHHANH